MQKILNALNAKTEAARQQVMAGHVRATSSWTNTLAATGVPVADTRTPLAEQLPKPEVVARSFACRIGLPGHKDAKMTSTTLPIQKAVGYGHSLDYVQADIVLDSYATAKASLLELFRAYVLPGMTEEERRTLADDINSTLL